MLEIFVTLTVGALTAALLAPDLVRVLLRAQRAGSEGMAGARGEVIEDLSPDGWVRVRGERWAARCETSAALGRGATIEVVSLNGLTAIVRPCGPVRHASPDTRSWARKHPVRAAALALSVGSGVLTLFLFSSGLSALLPLLAALVVAVLLEADG